MTAKLFETALGIAEPWSVASVAFDETTKVLTISIDFLPGIVAWAQTHQTNGFLEALNGLFQAAKRCARGFIRNKESLNKPGFGLS